MEKFKKIARVAIPAAMLLAPLLSLAVTPITPPDVSTSGNPITLDEISTIIQRVAQWLIFLSIIIAVIFIVWGGIKYMTSRGDPKAAEAARGTIIHGIIGAAVVLGVGVILNTLRGLISRSFFS